MAGLPHLALQACWARMVRTALQAARVLQLYQALLVYLARVVRTALRVSLALQVLQALPAWVVRAAQPAHPPQEPRLSLVLLSLISSGHRRLLPLCPPLKQQQDSNLAHLSQENPRRAGKGG